LICQSLAVTLTLSSLLIPRSPCFFLSPNPMRKILLILMVLSGVLITPKEVTASNVKMIYQTNSVTNVIYISGVSYPAPVMLGIHAYATNHGYTLVAADRAVFVNGSAYVTSNNVQGIKIALYQSIQTNVAQVTMNKTVYSITNSYLNIHFCGSEIGYASASSKGVTIPYLPLTSVGQVNTDYTSADIIHLNYSISATEHCPSSIVFTDIRQGSGLWAPDSKSSPGKCITLPEVGSGLYNEQIAFCAPTNFPADSIKPEVASFLLTYGAAPLSLLTGNPSDFNDTVFITGRNMSGVREAVLTGLGLSYFTPLRLSLYNSFQKSMDLIPYSEGHCISGNAANSVVDFGRQTNCVYGNNSNLKGRNWLIGFADSISIKGKGAKFLPLGYGGITVSSNGICSDFTATVHCYVNTNNLVTLAKTTKKDPQMVWDVANGIVQEIYRIPATNYPAGFEPFVSTVSTDGMWNGWTAPPF
jgi:hypothetical protein